MRTPGVRGGDRVRVRAGARLRGRARGRAGDRGQAAVEYLGFLPILLLIGLVGVQLGIVGYAAQQAGTAARAAARAESVDDPDGEVPDGEAAGRAAMSGWVAGRSSFDVGGGRATVTVTVPSLIPFMSDVRITKSATMPVPE
ncbi:TadE/TadG family type IV pilus assembly protein [Streptomyces sp. NPDC090025]|uniref:TadE/TadG family type IV pilus assembly protein n=1 Tax=Streptomyces sp. NPDC090025 TaxID=3365922 RepID=UPI0038390F2D